MKPLMCPLVFLNQLSTGTLEIKLPAQNCLFFFSFSFSSCSCWDDHWTNEALAKHNTGQSKTWKKGNSCSFRGE